MRLAFGLAAALIAGAAALSTTAAAATPAAPGAAGVRAVARQNAGEGHPQSLRATAKGKGKVATVKKGAARTVVWRDDFSGPAGAPADSRWWTYQQGGYGWGNKELQYYTDETRNAALDGNGRLVITAHRDDGSRACWYGPCGYTSARLTTESKVTATSGKIEARLKVPHGAGLWPAFWMLGDNIRTVSWPQCGEIDIMEYVGDQPGEIWSSVHGPGYTLAGLTGAYRLPVGQSFADNFHTYAMEWTPTGVAFSVDGTTYHRVDRSAIGAGNEWVFDKPMHVVLNLAVGGTWGGTPPPETRFPARLEVDYVAFYR